MLHCSPDVLLFSLAVVALLLLCGAVRGVSSLAGECIRAGRWRGGTSVYGRSWGCMVGK